MVHGEKYISIKTSQKWFKRFEKGADNVEDLPRSGRPVEFNYESLKSLVEEPQ